MFVFVFPYVENLTTNYHPEGGMVVVAESIDRAVAMANERGAQPSEDEIAKVKVYKTAKSVAPEVFIFPDAGCC